MVQARIDALPEAITDADAVRSAYGIVRGDDRESDLGWIVSRLRGRLSVLVECDAQIVNDLYAAIRQMMTDDGLLVRGRDAEPGEGQFRLHMVQGRERRRRVGGEGDAEEGAEERGPMGDLISRTMAEIEDFVQSAAERTILVIRHFDILATTTKSGLGREARILLQLLDDRGIQVLAFKDPEYELPDALLRAFPAKRSLIGIPREALVPPGSLMASGPGAGPPSRGGRTRHSRAAAPAAPAGGGGIGLITRAEARKFGLDTFDPYALYKYLSGTNAIRVRQILSQFADRNDFDPANPETADRIYREIRELTVASDLEVPRVHLENDIGGYPGVKARIREILELVRMRDEADTPEQAREIEKEIPRGILFEGPPGTGKTYFAKALATALGATTIVVSGPEIKSKWVGESEQNLRNLFTRARKSAPAVIVFDEIDSIAGARDSDRGSTGIEHGIVNTLLTEMDGFRKEELVFVVGTTNFAKSLDPALLRPGRFEFRIEVAAPNDADRRAILELLFGKARLDVPKDVLDLAVKETAGYADSANRRNFAGDDLRAIVAKITRARRLSGGAWGEPVTREEVEGAVRDTVIGGRSGGGFETPDVDFAEDIAGYEGVKRRIRREFLDMIEIRERMIREGAPVDDIAALEARIPRGILLWGPPGTGKTYFAKALATSLGGSLIVISAAELKSKWYGETEENIRDVFAQARASAPSVIVFDELDSIAKARGGGAGSYGDSTNDSIVNTLLTEMDGFRGDELVFVVGTTNRPDTLDQALLRPSRLALKIEVPAPGDADRRAILGHYARRAGLDILPEDLDRLVQMTRGLTADGRRFAGDDLKAIIENIQNKKMRSKFGYKSNSRRRRNGEAVTMSEIEAALEEVGGPSAMGGGPRKLTAEEKAEQRRGTAYHEAGHAIASALTPGASFPIRVSIDAPEDADFLGVTMKDAKEGNLTKREMLAEIGAALGGRIADELTGTAETGAHSDLEQATNLAGVMVAELGMSERLGPVVYGRRKISEEFTRLVDEEIRDVVKGEYVRVRQLLEENRQVLDDMASLLLDNGTLGALELAEFFTSRGLGEYVPKTLAGQAVKKNRGRRRR